jgi:hypothetical protein
MDPRRLLIAALLFAAAVPARAEVYKWVDENGKVTYSNVRPPGAAGKAEAVEEKISVMGMDPAVRAAAERRFAAQAQAEELEWQRRQQAMLLQQASQPAPAPATSDSYYPSYYPYAYAPYTYRASYYPAYYRPAVRARLNYYANHAPRPVHHHTRPGPAPRFGPPPRGGVPRPR